MGWVHKASFSGLWHSSCALSLIIRVWKVCYMGVRRLATPFNRVNRRRLNRFLFLNILDGHTRATSASPGRIDNFWKVHRYETLDLLFAKQGDGACRETTADLCEWACLRVVATVSERSVSHGRSVVGSVLTLSYSLIRGELRREHPRGISGSPGVPFGKLRLLFR